MFQVLTQKLAKKQPVVSSGFSPDAKSKRYTRKYFRTHDPVFSKPTYRMTPTTHIRNNHLQRHTIPSEITIQTTRRSAIKEIAQSKSCQMCRCQKCIYERNYADENHHTHKKYQTCDMFRGKSGFERRWHFCYLCDPKIISRRKQAVCTRCSSKIMRSSFKSPVSTLFSHSKFRKLTSESCDFIVSYADHIFGIATHSTITFFNKSLKRFK